MMKFRTGRRPIGANEWAKACGAFIGYLSVHFLGHLGLWGWALSIALAIAVGVILDKVFKKKGVSAPDVGISHDDVGISHDEVLYALHRLGGTRLVWDAVPVGDGRLEIYGQHPLEIDGLHLEDTTGKPVRVGWERYEDDAYELANRYSDVPGHYMLDLPSGALTSPRYPGEIADGGCQL